MAKVPPTLPGVVLMDSAGNEIPLGGGNLTLMLTSAAATAAAPAYVEATQSPLSQDLEGRLRVRSTFDTSSVLVGAAEVTPKFAPIAVSSSGANTVVAAVGGKKIRVLGYAISGNGNVNAKFVSHGGSDLTGLFYLGQNTGAVVGFSPVGWFETAVGAALDINLSGATAVGGHVVYIEV